MFDYEMEHVFSYNVTLDPPEVIGPGPEGIRVNFYVTGGGVTGPKAQGKIKPVGGDWLTVRTDGVGILDVRATIETGDGALIYLSYTGVGDLGEDGYERFLRGDLPGIVPLRVVPRFLTAHPDYLWINRLQCVAVGQVNLESLEVAYDVYALR
ncbi:MAG: DUF3237 domain-containing protein [Actinomycetota bacterium]|nr:DUF3237 domain-containing protein [Actinomycetota bacterium]